MGFSSKTRFDTQVTSCFIFDYEALDLRLENFIPAQPIASNLPVVENPVAELPPVNDSDEELPF